MRLRHVMIWDVPAVWIPVNIELSATLDSGQAFRWYPHWGGYLGVMKGWLAFLEPCEGGVLARGLGEAESQAGFGDRIAFRFWRDVAEYLDQDRDYGAIALKLVEKDELVGTIAMKTPGLRLLRQEPWEVLASFVLSSHNNVSRIKGMVRSLASKYGKRIERGGTAYHLFPSPDRIARLTEDELRSRGLGFRAPYLLELARAVAGGSLDIEDLARLPLVEGKRRLMRFAGVGEKISECVLLFGFQKTDAFPIDVWIKRVMERLYFAGHGQPYHVLREFAARRYGELAGFAQNWLYHHARFRERKQV